MADLLKHKLEKMLIFDQKILEVAFAWKSFLSISGVRRTGRDEDKINFKQMYQGSLNLSIKFLHKAITLNILVSFVMTDKEITKC